MATRNLRVQITPSEIVQAYRKEYGKEYDVRQQRFAQVQAS